MYNFGFDHRLEAWAFTWGASYQKRGEAERWTNASAETKLIRSIDYEGNLELFLEKTIADRYVVRLAAQNLLDARRTEIERDFESVEQIQAGTPDRERSLIEVSDPVVHPDLPRHVLAPRRARRNPRCRRHRGSGKLPAACASSQNSTRPATSVSASARPISRTASRSSGSRCGLRILSSLPLPAWYGIASFLAFILDKVMKSRHEIIDMQLAACFPDRDAAWIRARRAAPSSAISPTSRSRSSRP